MPAVDLILAKLDGAREISANSYRSICPSCGGKNRSKFALRAEPDGRILLHCFSGCSIEQITAALGIDLADLMPERAPEAHRVDRIKKPWTARDVAKALELECGVAWLLLLDLADGRPMSASDRKRAGAAAQRCAHLLRELAQA